MEALAHWCQPRLGPVHPELFLNVAERYRQTNSIADALLALTLRSFQSLHGGCPGIRPALDLSPFKLGDPRLIEILDQLLDQLLAYQGIPADLITIRLTRGSVLRPNPLVFANLAQLRSKGMAIGLDDCGTRFACLSRLHPWRPDAVPLPGAPVAPQCALEHFRPPLRRLRRDR